MNIATNDAQIQPRVSRRGLIATLTAGAALAPAAALAGSAGPMRQSKDLHRTWWEEWQRIAAFVSEHPTGQGPDIDVAHERRFEIDDLMANTKAISRDGIIAQMEWLIEDGRDHWGCDLHDNVARNVVTALREAA